MVSFPFSGSKNSFFGDLHGTSRESLEFYPDKIVLVERRRNEQSRKS
jgi:malonate-semialdehyde dehydrogenase (acetylating)/methylmalonate-semialdehyde dehydrogenase